MSRSRRKHTWISSTCLGYNTSEKEDKRTASKRFRRAVRALLSQGITEFPSRRTFGNPWYWRKWGKCWLDPKEWPCAERK